MSNVGETGFCFPYDIKETAHKGRGVFSGAVIKRGEILWRFRTGLYEVFDERSFRTYITGMTDAEVRYELTHVFGFADFPGCLIRIGDDGVLINHSGNPNAATNFAAAPSVALEDASPHYLQHVRLALLEDRYALIATRDIQSGEELTNNYETDAADPPFYDVLYAEYGVEESYQE